MGSFDTVMIAGCHGGWIIVTLPHQSSFLNSPGSSPFFHGRINGTSVYLHFVKMDIEYVFHIRINCSLVNKVL